MDWKKYQDTSIEWRKNEREKHVKNILLGSTFESALHCDWSDWIKAFAKLCQMGGLRRRLPVMGICGLFLLVWFLVWTICYFKRKKAGKIKIDEK